MTDPPPEVPEPEESGRSVFAKWFIGLVLLAIPLLFVSIGMWQTGGNASCESPASAPTQTLATALFWAMVVWDLAIICWSVAFVIGGAGSTTIRVFKSVAAVGGAALLTYAILMMIFFATFYLCW